MGSLLPLPLAANPKASPLCLEVVSLSVSAGFSRAPSSQFEVGFTSSAAVSSFDDDSAVFCVLSSCSSSCTAFSISCMAQSMADLLSMPCSELSVVLSSSFSILLFVGGVSSTAFLFTSSLVPLGTCFSDFWDKVSSSGILSTEGTSRHDSLGSTEALPSIWIMETTCFILRRFWTSGSPACSPSTSSRPSPYSSAQSMGGFSPSRWRLGSLLVKTMLSLYRLCLLWTAASFTAGTQKESW